MDIATTPDLVNTLAPTGTLRASINVGNPILARTDSAQGAAGVSVDLVHELAKKLGVTCKLGSHDAAAQSVEAVTNGQTDVGCCAIDPVRGQELAFRDPYVLIEGAYLVHNTSPLQDNNQVDQPGHRIMVGQGSAYDLYLSRNIQHAELIRAPTSPRVVEYFLKEGADVAAGVKQQLQVSMENESGLRLLPGRFMVIRQAMGVSKKRGAQAHAFVQAFVAHARDTGLVAHALERHGISGASVAQAGD